MLHLEAALLRLGPLLFDFRGFWIPCTDGVTSMAPTNFPDSPHPRAWAAVGLLLAGSRSCHMHPSEYTPTLLGRGRDPNLATQRPHAAVGLSLAHP